MAVLSILKYPDPRLQTVARPVAHIDERIQTLVADMAETMYAAPGVGLAATQINVHERVVVMDISENHDQLMVLINPEIIWTSPEKKVYEEGCLSVPQIYDKLERPDLIKIKALSLNGETFELDADGLLSVCIQHELDHLNGLVFVDHLSTLKQTRIRNKLKKQQHEREEETKSKHRR
jgi:peptide deformylase